MIIADSRTRDPAMSGAKNIQIDQRHHGHWIPKLPYTKLHTPERHHPELAGRTRLGNVLVSRQTIGRPFDEQHAKDEQ